MIRIDEIYQNTFWPWFKQNKIGTRIFLCDPFGRSDPDSIISYDDQSIQQQNYVFFFDQEPIDSNRHATTMVRIQDINHLCLSKNGLPYKTEQVLPGCIVTSEKDSETIAQICDQYNIPSAYYFFHGWAALDWYRGYNQTFLMSSPQERVINKTFIMPNRIIAGQRQHRLLMLYHIFKNNLKDNWISCPAICPAENIDINTAVRSLSRTYPDIGDVFFRQTFPMQFPGETNHPMHSCWLSLFDESAECLLYLVTETVATGRRLHLTEKTFKPICLQMPFIIVGTAGSLEYLHSYGFKTFSSLWDESYDGESNDIVRLEKIAQLLKELDALSQKEKQELFHASNDIIQHNYNHFYNGGFEKILWAELINMLETLPI
ncbi:hypothetical protein UFOVP1146_372 [uncultured Caudovirales phage]|uniref:Uncharacterized protein n=1 Tax=uncultured Caudovirales phage TaxID=2100421 RepID=A0A6J5QWY4_9CAUD|nr:hypothetical protein UFOVP812_285 [uncultured Caudovirales phage]CAB4165744.1 hypothetical protein UFOVP818_280 [uncultured Caudovirales phage]CAB4187026.1 hypothetical protein UFOVP1146_372 [uncultured Caudovirales phage]CAB4221184.1 hypothetical protein UFOVP1638_193 [uncultured Caudovirales phage]